MAGIIGTFKLSADITTTKHMVHLLLNVNGDGGVFVMNDDSHVGLTV